MNLVLPLLRPGDVQAAAEADAIVTFWGEPRRLAAGTWVHQCGSVQEAQAAEAAGADAVIAQGVEAGGHVRGTTPLLDLIERVRAAVKIPVLAAGGIVDEPGVREALDAGAVAAVLGTRFLLSEESRAHPDYKLRCLQADRTILTELFGLGWAEAPHRVVPNAATRRWLSDDDSRGPGWIRLVNRLASPLVMRVPEGLQDRGLAIQRPSLPFLGPPMALDDGPRQSPGLGAALRGLERDSNLGDPSCHASSHRPDAVAGTFPFSANRPMARGGERTVMACRHYATQNDATQYKAA